MDSVELYQKAIRGPWKTAGDDLQYRIERIGGVVHLFFQGSASREDWKNNFDFPAKPYRDMPEIWYAHRGLVGLYNTARGEIMASLKATVGLGERQWRVKCLPPSLYS